MGADCFPAAHEEMVMVLVVMTQYVVLEPDVWVRNAPHGE